MEKSTKNQVKQPRLVLCEHGIVRKVCARYCNPDKSKSVNTLEPPAAWQDIETVKALPMEMPHAGKMLIADGKAVSVGRFDGCIWSILGLGVDRLTHWMPLPLPPNDKQT